MEPDKGIKLAIAYSPSYLHLSGLLGELLPLAPPVAGLVGELELEALLGLSQVVKVLQLRPTDRRTHPTPRAENVEPENKIRFS